MDFVPATMTRQHFKRLRWYFTGGSRGVSSQGDGIDLDLCAHGYIQRKEVYNTLIFLITQSGEIALAHENALERERRAHHHTLGGRLAQWLRSSGRMTWENIEFLTECAGEDGYSYKKASRPDVFSVKPTYNVGQVNPIVHEVKVSRADFLSDMKRPEKREAYQAYSEAFYFACPHGLIDAAEIPQGTGLVYELSPGEFSVIKRPKRKQVVLAPRIFMNLILKPGKVDPLG